MDIGFGFGDDTFFETNVAYAETNDVNQVVKNEVHPEREKIVEKKADYETEEPSVPKDLCVALTIKYILKNGSSRGALKLHDFPLTAVIIFGKILSIEDLASTTVYEVCDYTGTIAAKYNKDTKDEHVTNYIGEIKEGDHIQIIGVVYKKDDTTDAQISITHMKKVEDWVSYFTFFTSEIIYSFLKLKQIRSTIPSVDDVKEEDKPWSHIELDANHVIDYLDKTDIDILKFLYTKTNKTTNEEDVIINLSKFYSEINIKQSISKLVENGDIAQDKDTLCIPF